jgi:hypothetical protein
MSLATAERHPRTNRVQILAVRFTPKSAKSFSTSATNAAVAVSDTESAHDLTVSAASTTRNT